MYPHPYDCTKFLQCSNGATYIQACGPGTAFDSLRSLCDYKHKVKCCAGCTMGNTTESNLVTKKDEESRFVTRKDVESAFITEKNIELRECFFGKLA